MFLPIGDVVRKPCACGTVCDQREGVTTPGEPAFFAVFNHKAPCGLPCLSGGVDGPTYKTGQFHKVNGPCPACEYEFQTAMDHRDAANERKDRRPT
jgi:hypothetical protein